MTCSKCEQPPEHVLQIREGDPSRNPNNHTPDKSTLRIVKLCDHHWREVRSLLGL